MTMRCLASAVPLNCLNIIQKTSLGSTLSTASAVLHNGYSAHKTPCSGLPIGAQPLFGNYEGCLTIAGLYLKVPKLLYCFYVSYVGVTHFQGILLRATLFKCSFSAMILTCLTFRDLLC